MIRTYDHELHRWCILKQIRFNMIGKSLTTAINRNIISIITVQELTPTNVTLPLGSCAARCAGSIPVTRTK